MTISVYAASSSSVDAVYLEAAREAGRLLAARGHTMLFGGGATGLMGACAEAAIAGGGRVVGVSPAYFDEPGVLLRSGCTLHLTETMAERKAWLLREGEGFLVLPGGIGTYEEFFDTLTLKSLGKITGPMVLLNTAGAYEPLLAMLRAGAAGGFLREEILTLFAVCRSPAEALRALET